MGVIRTESWIMPCSGPVYERNRALADQINDEALRDPNSPYVGKFVGIANGQVIATGDDPDEVIDRLEQVEPDPSHCFCFEAGIDYTRVEEIWEFG